MRYNYKFTFDIDIDRRRYHMANEF